jgi:predicted acylesterase/phospholipase RssA
MNTISKNDVYYLSLEGGGGAGNGYFGALKALHELGILEYKDFKQTRIKGFAGASAGAITSVLLACGYTPQELGKIIQAVDFESFFDFGDVGEIPVISGFEQKIRNRVRLNALFDLPLNYYKFALQPQLDLFHKLGLNSVGSGGLLFITLHTLFHRNLPPKILKLVLPNLDKVKLSVENDFGIFLGRKLRIFMQDCINLAKLRIKEPDIFLKLLGLEDFKNAEAMENNIAIFIASPNLDSKFPSRLLVNSLKTRDSNFDLKGTTFSDFKNIFGCDLVIMGTNLETNKSHAFCKLTTPEFYVEDAIRISTSLPLIYKPFIIRNSDNYFKNKLTDDYILGTWVDGGYLNNSPVDIFESKQTLGLRIEQLKDGKEKRHPINNLGDFLSQYPLNIGIFGTGEAHISETMNIVKQFNTIMLDTKMQKGDDKNFPKEVEIGLMDFKPDPSLFDAVNKKTYKAVKDYFK